MKNLRSYLTVTLLYLCTSTSLHATCPLENIFVTSVTEFKSAINVINNTNNNDKGYLITMKDGVYTETLIKQITRNSDCPCVIKAETTNGVKLETGVYLNFLNARNIQFRGFFFKNKNYYSRKTIGVAISKNIIIADCTFTEDPAMDPNLISYATGSNYYYYLEFHRGYDYRAVNCKFIDKVVTSGHYLNMSVTKNCTELACDQHQIRDCYFGPYDLKGKAASMIKIGGCGAANSHDAAVVSKIMISNNYFEGYNSENDSYQEIISNKSSGNIYLDNTFKNCNGRLFIRCGSGCTIRRNRFLGNVSNSSSNGGIRLNGANHTITNNYFQSLRSDAIYINGGNTDDLDDYTLAYVRVRDCKFIHNTFYDCGNSFRINKWPNAYQIPKNCVFVNNIMSARSCSVVIDDEYSPSDVPDWETNVFKKNIVYSNTGCPINNSDFDQPFFSNFNYWNTNPNMVGLGSTHYIPSNTSVANNNGIYTIKKDIHSVLRKKCPDIGCHEILNQAGNIAVKCLEHASPLELRKKQLDLSLFPNPSQGQFYLNSSSLLGEDVRIKVYDLLGNLVDAFHYPEVFEENIELQLDLENGIYLLQLETANGLHQTLKLLLQK